MKKVSIIVPIFNEKENVNLLYDSLVNNTKNLNVYKFEFILVNDGSKDNSLTELKKIVGKDKRFVILDFSRNFGKELALTAGLEYCSGDAAIFLDADLQHPAELIPDFIKKWEGGADVVSGIRLATKKKSFIKDIGSRLFYLIINKLGDAKLIPNSTDFKLIDRKVINALLKFTERNRMFRGLIDWCGYTTEYIEFTAPERLHGESTYSISKLLRLAINSFTSFSLLPLKITGYLGGVVTLFSLLLLLFMFVCTFVIKNAMFSSIAFVIVSNTLILGIVLTCLGLIALYIAQIHTEVINRPLYIIREVIRGKINDDE
jgi:dolichol-phosphate mannosyltransferase